MTKPAIKVTPGNLDQAQGLKSIGYLMMTPYQFLSLTAEYPVETWLRQEEEAKRTLTVEQYNEFQKNGKSIHMPWLYIAIECDDPNKNGKVVDHEGRHRAAALINAGRKDDVCFPVAIMLCEQGKWPKYREELPPDYKKRYLSLEDIPMILKGQFLPTKVKLPAFPKFKSFYAAYMESSLKNILARLNAPQEPAKPATPAQPQQPLKPQEPLEPQEPAEPDSEEAPVKSQLARLRYRIYR